MQRVAQPTMCIEADALKVEMRPLQNDFLMNFNRQHEDTTVTNGLTEHEGESKNVRTKSILLSLKLREPSRILGSIPSGK